MASSERLGGRAGGWLKLTPYNVRKGSQSVHERAVARSRFISGIDAIFSLVRVRSKIVTAC
jgi:hypothetical protein